MKPTGIDPSRSDIGRAVVYASYEGRRGERGVITRFNHHWVFVRYGSDTHAKATRREHLSFI